MSWHRYERDGYVIETGSPLSDEQIEERFTALKALHARQIAARKLPRNPLWNAEDVVERFGGDVLRPARSSS